MFLRVILAAAGAVGLAAAADARAATVTFDDFEGYGSASQANFTGFTHLTVTAGSVNYVDEADSGLSTPYGHGMVDTDGSSGNPGILRTPEVALAAGTKVRWELDAAGNMRVGPDIRRMGFVSATTPYHLTDIWFDFGAGKMTRPDFMQNAGGSYFFTLPTFAPDAPWKHFAVGATLVNAATLGAFVADPLGATVGNNQGVLIDNIHYSAVVPEPAAWALLIGGFGLAGAALRRRRTVAA